MVAMESDKKGKPQRRRGRKGKKETFEKESNIHEVQSSSIHKPHQTLLIRLNEDSPTWYQCGSNAPHRNDTIYTKSIYTFSKKKHSKKNFTPKTNSYELVAKYRTIADSIYQQELNLFKFSSSNSDEQDKDEQWVENTMKRGTLKDRIAAMSVVVSGNPVHKLYALDMLLQLAGVDKDGGAGGGGQTNDRVSQMASEALTDLFTNTLLPSNRKLIGLEARPFFLYEENNHDASMKKLDISPRTLLLWRYEEILKNKYTAFLTQYLGRTLSSQSGSTSLDLTKIQCLRTACSLLKDLPEGEQLLLTLVVNKIGDPSKKVASSAAHELRGVLNAHPNMTNVIAREVQQLAHRPNLSTRALYNCIIFLNQLKLVKEEDNDENDDDDKEKNGAKAKQLDQSSLPASLINTYFQIFEVAVNNNHTNNSNKNKKKGGKEQQLKASPMDLAMKGRLLGALLTGVNRAHPYLPTKDIGMEQHVDSLYRIAHVSPPSACTQALMLLFHLAVGSSTSHEDEEESFGIKKKVDIKEARVIAARKDRFYRVLYSKLSDPTMFAGRQQTLFFNLLYKAMKYDDNELRVVAFGKRLIHVAFHQCPSIVSGALFLVSEVMKNQRQLERSVFSSDGHQVEFDPSKREPSAAFSLSEEKTQFKDDQEQANNDDDENESSIEGATMWEVALTLNHYHPTVNKFSSTLNEINYKGDPLRDFALAPFLDKFAFKNPKSFKKISEKLRRGESIGERRSGLQGNVQALSSLPVNDPKFWREGNAISEQEEFFQKFFVERARRDEVKGIVRGKSTKSVEDDAFEQEEGKDVDFDWETDDEEEAFVEKLAESLMEGESGGKANFDDEDPDMDDWSGYDGSDADEDDNFDASQFEDFDAEKLKALGIAADDFENDDKDEKEGDDEDDDLMNDAFNAAEYDEEEEDSSDDDGALGLALGADDLNSDEDEEDNENDTKAKGTKVEKNQPSFADASSYEDLINKSFLQRYTSNGKRDIEESEEQVSNNKSRKKRRKKINK